MAVVIIVLLLPLTVETEIKHQEGSVLVGPGPTRVEISVEGFSQLKAGSVVVYLKPPHEQLAQEVAQALQEALQLCSSRLGIPAALISVALFPREDFEGFATLSFRVKEPGIWPLFISRSWKSLSESDMDFQNSLYWTMPHEAIEASTALLFYHDWHQGWPSRWIGDGLANYAGYIVTKDRASQVVNARLYDYKQKITRILEEGKGTYDLIRDFVGSDKLQLAGYGIALAFWLDIAQRYGEETIRKFWQRTNTLARRWCLALGLICFGGVDAQKAARILSELTGEDIWAKLQQIDLQEVLRTLEAARAH
jgi:hypothetical protein